MPPLKVANIQKCLSILKDFHNKVPVDDSNKELKEQAGYALDHLTQLFRGEPGYFELETGPCKTDPRLKS